MEDELAGKLGCPFCEWGREREDVRSSVSRGSGAGLGRVEGGVTRVVRLGEFLAALLNVRHANSLPARGFRFKNCQCSPTDAEGSATRLRPRSNKQFLSVEVILPVSRLESLKDP